MPAGLIAQQPTERREHSRLLVLPARGSLQHRRFAALPVLLRAGDLLIANDTRVRRARLRAKRRGGGAAELLLLHPLADHSWEAMVRPAQRIRVGDRLELAPGAHVDVIGRTAEGNRIVRFAGLDAVEAMERFGELPLPPYIKKPPPKAAARYQTVYAAHDGSAAAPTAGLHFSTQLIARLKTAGAGWTTITLHVGSGTFRPVRSDDLSEHVMHAERYEISSSAAAAITRTRAIGGRIVAVGTTVLRALEASGGQAGAQSTDLFIYPPYRFKLVDVLITNFHLPRSTLLMLACAFGGKERVMSAYAEAIRLGYRFYSFGDAMLIERVA